MIRQRWIEPEREEMLTASRVSPGPVQVPHHSGPVRRRARIYSQRDALPAIFAVLVGGAVLGTVGTILLAAPWPALVAAPLVASVLAQQVGRSLFEALARPCALQETDAPVTATVLAVSLIVHRRTDSSRVEDFVTRNASAVVLGAVPIVFLVDGPDSEAPEHSRDSLLKAGLIEAAERAQTRTGVAVQVLWRRRRLVRETGLFCGWERKRGKIETYFVALTSTDSREFENLFGSGPDRGADRVFLADIDTTLLPRTLEQLTRKMTHPAFGDHAIATPRIAVPLHERRSIFARAMGGGGADDLSHRPHASLRQDLLGADLFFGKGLVDVRRFLGRTRDQLPEQAILSHDHIEGMVAGAAFASDAVILESAPPTLGAWLRRHHRWVRGDTQNLAFVLPRSWVRRPPAKGVRLTALDRTELVMNVLNHLQPAALLAMVLSWIAVPDALWTISLIAALCLAPSAAGLFVWLVVPPAPARSRLAVVKQGLEVAIAGAARFAILPQVAAVGLDGVARGLWSLVISPAQALRWPSGDVVEGRTLSSVTGLLAGAVVLGLAWPTGPAHAALAATLAIVWSLSPLLFGLRPMKSPAVARP